MTLSDPTGLWLLGLLAPLALLYLLRFRARREPVTSLWLWRGPDAQGRRPRPARKWRTPLSFWLQTCALASLAIAASGPVSHGLVAARQVVIVIDTSASMQSLDELGRSRLELAKRHALGLVDGMTPGTAVMLLSASESVGVLTAFERDRRRLRREISQLHADDVRGRLQPALDLAREKLRGGPGEKLLVLITDGVLAERMLPQPADVPLEVVRVGAQADNLAITQIDVRSERAAQATALGRTRVFVSVENFGKDQRTVSVSLHQRNVSGVLAARQLQLEPGEERPTTLQFEHTPQDAGAGIEVVLTPADALTVDDRAFAVIPEPGRQPVVLVSEQPSPSLERALRADGDLDLVRSRPGEPLESHPHDAFIIYLYHCPQHAPASHFLVVAPPAGACLSARVGRLLEAPVVTHWEESDARFRFVSLTNLQLTEARELTPDSPNDVLVWSREAALMTSFSIRETNGTLVGFDFERSDWPLSASFVLFIRNLVDLAREGRHHSREGRLRAGDSIRVRVPRDVQSVEARLPDGQQRTLPAAGGSALLPRAAKSGHYYFAWQGQAPGSTLVPVNTADAEESDPAIDPLPEANAEGPTSVQLERPTSAAVWFALLALTLVLADVLLMTHQLATPTRRAV